MELSRGCRPKQRISQGEITTPVLVLDGNIYPTLGGDFPGNLELSSMQALAANVTGITLPFQDTGFHKLLPQFVINQLFKFFGNSDTGTN